MSENVFLFIPNIIGYIRVITLIISFYYMPTTPLYAAFFYLLSNFLDAFDGLAARRFSQTSGFGAVLDMVTDRCATVGLMVVLSNFYPDHILTFQLLILLDIFSHWLQVYSSMLHGESSHKFIDLAANPIMKFYYERPVLFVMCAGNELFFCSLYLLYFTNGPVLPFIDAGAWWLLLFCSTPIFVLKQLVSIIQLVVASQNIAGMDVADRARTRNQS
ncbi:CDP-diacylglycerol--inositol 3-phosphatidyltransferase-like [Dysidea avara]|uniref:CDP-diacylglycerol--inositol 3-phosphatidyltransferase-like n=1 Tax=Dysidea avara TaxID=196820 RepID=UPI00331863B3